MKNKIRINCPNCDRTNYTCTDKSDPVGTSLVQTLCPECCDKLCAHHPAIRYFDIAGKELIWNGDE